VDDVQRLLGIRSINAVGAILAGVLAGYVVIAVLNNEGPAKAAQDPLPSRGVVQTQVFVNWVERQNRGRLAHIASREIWTIATAHPEAVVACVKLLVAKEDLVDRFGNSLTRDVRLLEAVATRLDQVRRYPSPDAYVDDQDGAAGWHERSCS
jgi:hypothetical protein